MALDSGIAKMGLFAFVLLVAFAGIITLIPTEMVYGYDYSNPADKVPESWNGIELGGYNFTDSWNTTIILTDTSHYFAIGGRNLVFRHWSLFTEPRYMRIFARYGFGLLWEEALAWFNEDDEDLGGIIEVSILDESYEEYGNLEFELVCLGLGAGSAYFKIIGLLSFNITAYETPKEAWANDDLDILFGINAENTNYQKDIWYLIQNLLTFNTLYVFGTTEIFAVILNGIIASIIYGAIIIFAMAVILEVLPF